MAGFFHFHPLNPRKRILQQLNFAAFLISVCNLSANQDASMTEDGIVMLVHLLNHIALEEQANFCLAAVSSYMNGMRLGVLAQSLADGSSQHGVAFNLISGLLSALGSFNVLNFESSTPNPCVR